MYFDPRLGKGEAIYYCYRIMRMVAEVDRVDLCQCHAPIYDHRWGFDRRTHGIFSRGPWTRSENQGGGPAIIVNIASWSIFGEETNRAVSKSIIIPRNVEHIWGPWTRFYALQHMGMMTDIGYHGREFRWFLVFRGQHIWLDMAMSGAWYMTSPSRI